MRTTTSAIQWENPGTRNRIEAVPPTPYRIQAAAHLRFIVSGLWLTVRALTHGTRTLPAAERLALHRRIARYTDFLVAHGIIRVEFHGFDDAADWRGCVIAPNHPSILDAILLISRLPGIDCVMNARLLRSPIMSGAARLCGFIRNDTPLSMVRDTRDRLRAGHNVLIFPEGTRTAGSPVSPFRHGFASAAARAGAPVRTILVECDSDYFGRDFSFFRPAPCPIRYRITASRIFRPEPDDDPRAVSADIEAFFRTALVRGENGVRRTS